jgi:hypothetical protein
MVPRTYIKQETVYSAQDVATHLFFLSKGDLEVGLQKIQAPDCVGEAAFFAAVGASHRLYDVNCVVTSAVAQVLVVCRSAFDKLLASPDLSYSQASDLHHLAQFFNLRSNAVSVANVVAFDAAIINAFSETGVEYTPEHWKKRERSKGEILRQSML